ncbi:MAG: hypothetical protein ABJA94_09105 [Rhodoglobus sp.]
MIIWSRWGILVILFFGLGVLLGFILMLVVGAPSSAGSLPGVFIGIGLMLSTVALYFFNKYVVDRHLDAPRAAVVYEKLAEPVRLDNGAVQTHRAIPLRHPETGQQLTTKPTSTLFFIPVRYWVFVLPAIGFIVFATSLVAVLSGRP